MGPRPRSGESGSTEPNGRRDGRVHQTGRDSSRGMALLVGGPAANYKCRFSELRPQPKSTRGELRRGWLRYNELAVAVGCRGRRGTTLKAFPVAQERIPAELLDPACDPPGLPGALF